VKEISAKAEQWWRGVSVSDGVAAGRVLRVHAGARYVYRIALEEAEIDVEIERFRTGVRLARRQLLAIKERAERALGAEHAYIFDAHLLMLEDGKLLTEIEELIRRERVNSEWAVKVATDRVIAVYRDIRDDYLRERGSDIEDVARRLLVALSDKSGEARGGNHGRLMGDAVIVAEELLPSAIVELDFTRVRAIASDAGGWTSHTAIIARGLRIPAIVGLRDLYRHARTGDSIFVDAVSGEVALHPSSSTLKRIQLAKSLGLADEHAKTEEANVSLDDDRSTIMTVDKIEITLRANVELPVEYEGVRRYGARGIGLFRSEFLWTQAGEMPSEEEQFAAYREVVELAGADGATIRFFDLGGDKIGLADDTEDAERNPALGLRAIRLSLHREELLRTQARAALRAAHGARESLRVVLPMISDIWEVRRARAIIDEERGKLADAGYAVGELKIGAMIEVPSAVMIADRLARVVDFFSLGTNDLVQYMLAVDRGNDEVAEWFRTLHPAVLEAIHRTLEAARANKIPAIVCGEMAASPAYAFILLGLGARELSMTAAALPRVRHTIRNIDQASAKSITEECLKCETAADVERFVREQLGEKWPHLFPPKSLP
jgi:phosphoenolpyruvate-protein phosphotransferase (PTS system enzyme I)